MAAEAVYRIKEAEETAEKRQKDASAEASDIIANAKLHGESKKKSIVKDAEDRKREMIERATAAAVSAAEPVVLKGVEEREKIVNPGADKLEEAIRLIVERIVN
ncbi:hypothetical protein LJC34_06650 [Oscillospiraceae bacterium OttesenSCG-928-G22]|nr:hypothetical protein [Oscillospiraceae bacterium OttesenSCG-928-G22]